MARVQIEVPETILFTTEVPVRISDVNYGNHLGHDSLISLLHEARVRFLHSLGMSEVDSDGLGMLVVDLAVRYRSEAFHGDLLQITIGADEIRSRSCELVYHVVNAATGKTVAEAKTGIVFFDRQAGKPGAIPAKLKHLLGGD